MTSKPEQYAVLLNGRLVGDTAFVFESRRAVERLVRLLGDLTGARASAVQRGWLVPDAPPFCLDRVSSWLDQAGPALTQRGHVPSISDPEVPLPDLAWPPAAWNTRPPPIPSSASWTTDWEGPPDPRTPDSVHPSYLDGVDGSLWDKYARAHDIDDWDVRPPRHLVTEAIALGDGWMEVETAPRPLYGPSFPTHVLERPDQRSGEPESEVPQRLVPDPLDLADSLSPLLGFYGYSDSLSGEPQEMTLTFAFQDGSRRLFDSALRFKSEQHRNRYLDAFRGALGAQVVAVRSFASAAEPQVSELVAWLGARGLTGGTAAALAHRLEGIEQDIAETQRRAAQQATLRQEAAQQLLQQQRDDQQQAAARQAEVQQLAALAEQARREQDRMRQEQQRQEAIRRLVHERGIQYLFHFTRMENLPGIRDKGLLSRAALGDDGCVWNDGWRGDDRRHAICLSIGYPNYKMFYNYRQAGGNWAVLLLDPCLLWERDCGFVEINAAAGDVPSRAEDELKTVDALGRMFGDDELRARLRLLPHYTTNPQAEVLVFEQVPPTYIKAIHVEELIQPLHLDCGGHLVPIRSDGTYFRGRSDYQHWQKPEWSIHG